MKNYKQRGDVMRITPAGGCKSGDPVLVGAILAVACVDIPAGGTGAAAVEGVFALPKGAEAITQGSALYWKAAGDPVGGTAGSGCLTATAPGNTRVGFAFEPAGETDPLVDISLEF